MIVRFESWGAWVKLETTSALVALDRAGVRALGLDGGSMWRDDNEDTAARASASPSAIGQARGRATRPLEVHVAVTSRCSVGCEGCYLDARPDGIEPPRDAIGRTLDALARDGVFTVAFGGGEPTLREDLGDLADAARARGLTPVVTTSGLGLGERKLDRLARFAQVNVSYDGPGDAYAHVRGLDAAASAEDAIRRLAARGIDVGINVVLTRATFDRVRETLRRARALGAREAQLLRYKPQGRARSIDYYAKRLTPDQGRALGPLLRALTAELAADADIATEPHPQMRLRIDCALVPYLSADPSIRAEDLRRWGVLGCEAGALLGATRIDGRRAPCSFATPEEEAPFLAYADAPAEPCASCTLAETCRGGCKVVSTFVSGRVDADPECPRVRAWHTGRAGET